MCGVNNLCSLYLDIVPFVKDARLSEQSCFKSTIFVQKISYWICILRGGSGKMERERQDGEVGREEGEEGERLARERQDGKVEEREKQDGEVRREGEEREVGRRTIGEQDRRQKV